MGDQITGGQPPADPREVMKQTTTLASGYRLLTLTSLFVLPLLPSYLSAESGNHQICSEDSGYLHRRLDSDQQENLCEVYAGKVLLVVNTASRCAYTEQYDGLEKLYAKYQSQGLVVIGFPSNDFGNQEPGDERSIKDFCQLTYGVQFPMYAKTQVKGITADPFYAALISASGESPAWNFHKYMITFYRVH